jgi:hypothetical protein
MSPGDRTHGLHASRAIVAGASLPSVLPEIRDELLVGLAYFAIALLLLRHVERARRRAGSFNRF